MANFKEIVTKAVVSKGKKTFTTTNTVSVANPSTILGCWVINHNFNGILENHEIIITGSYDVNIWYSYDNDTKTEVLREKKEYREIVHMRDVEDVEGESIIVRSLKQPNCIHAEIIGDSISYTIEKELGIELVGDIKVKVEANLDEDPWDEIVDSDSELEDLKDDYIKEDNVI